MCMYKICKKCLNHSPAVKLYPVTEDTIEVYLNKNNKLNYILTQLNPKIFMYPGD